MSWPILRERDHWVQRRSKLIVSTNPLVEPADVGNSAADS